MVLKQEELLTKYFEHRMTGDEEQNFLIQLAASDDLRTAFRSHLELQRAIREDKDDLRAVAQVRNRTLTALGLSASAVTPFIEHELMKNAAATETQKASLVPSVSLFSRIAGVARNRFAILTSGLLLGFVAATAIFSSNSGLVQHGPAVSTTSQAPAFTPESAPATTATPSPAATTADETIQQDNGLNTKPRPRTADGRETADGSNAAVSSRADRVSGSTNVHGATGSNDRASIRTIDRTKPSVMTVKPAKVSKGPDTTTKE
jgi:hypothetical protein